MSIVYKQKDHMSMICFMTVPYLNTPLDELKCACGFCQILHVEDIIGSEDCSRSMQEVAVGPHHTCSFHGHNPHVCTAQYLS